MATVEQRDTQSAGLATLSNTLDLFNDFKDDKDSDEESFHLPMLDCDDDLDSNNKDAVTNEVTSSSEKDTQCQNGESEDDILNKFETNGTPDIDPKIEDKLLEDIEEVCEKKTREKVVETITPDKVISQETQCTEEKETSGLNSKELITEAEEINTEKPTVKAASVDTNEIAELKEVEDDSDELEDTEVVEHQDTVTEENMVTNEEEMETENKKLITEEEELPKQEEISDKTQQTDENTLKDSKVTNLEKESVIAEPSESHFEESLIAEPCESDIENVKDSTENKIEDEQIESVVNDSAKVEDENAAAEDITEQEELKEVSQINNFTESETLHLEGKQVEDKDEDKPIKENIITEKKEAQIENESEKMDVDSMEIETEHMELQVNHSLEITPNRQENIGEDKEVDAPNVENMSEIMDTDVPDVETDKIEEPKIDETVSDGDSMKNNTKETIDNHLVESSTEGEEIDETKLLEDCSTELNSTVPNQSQSDMLKEVTALNESVQQKETDHSKTETLRPDKCENSSDSSKSQNLECEDLLDISIIRDADEDNASAIAENANDAHSSEKSDNDDQDEGSDKADNELDENDMDQEESLLTPDKDDHMDFDDGNSSTLIDQENIVNGNASDSETKDYMEMRDSESDSNIDSVLKEKTNKIEDNLLDSESNQTEEVRAEPVDDGTKSAIVDDQDSLKENSPKLGGKRSLSEVENDPEATNKKIKLSDNAIITEKKKPLKKVKTLITFEKYMQNKKLENKLTRSDLEQFCLQKICEAIVHKTEVGELHQTIKKQEQIIENLRKDLQQLTKQTRDLDIVNKKLMNELRSQNGIKKPLVPLKITRSVGLQVKLSLNVENNPRRKTPVTANSRTPTPNNTPRQRAIAPANTNVVRQVASSPRKTPPSTTPLLSQALQNNRQISPANTSKRPPIRPKPSEPQKSNNPGVIDLTDEDDKASKAPTATPVKVLNKTIPIPQGKINIVQNKTTPNKTTTNVNNQNKTIAVGQVKSPAVGAKVATPTRTVTTLPQGVRLTPTQVKNGSITIPASVVTSSSGTTQLMYVVQPTSSLGQVVTSTAGGAQKAVLLNFQPTNGVLTSALNGSAVSVIPTKTTNTVQLKTVAVPRKHPAPLPTPPPVAVNASLKPLLPKPHLSIRKTDTGIILQWRMPYNLDVYESIASYQLFAYQETNAAPSTDMWRKVGDVKALALPMACTLTQFADKNKYYFAVRSVDVHKRIGAFSDPEEISL